jgi:predicted AAA+ superfamily ATPase
MDAERKQSWEQHLRKARESSCRLILLVGEARTGKTAFLQQLSEIFLIFPEDLERAAELLSVREPVAVL